MLSLLRAYPCGLLGARPATEHHSRASPSRHPCMHAHIHSHICRINAVVNRHSYLGSSLHKTCFTWPTVSAYHARRSQGRPETENMHARKCPSASGLGHLRACMSEAEGRGLGRRDRPRPAALTHVLCTDHPASG
eukprot:352114-Chlamydomonas_euryale.AAC.2